MGFGDVFGHAREVSIQAQLCRNRVRSLLLQIPPMPTLPNLRFLDHGFRTGENRTRKPTQNLVAGHVYRVEQGGDFGIALPVEWRAFPEPGAVEMEFHSACSPEIADGDESLPCRKLAADFSLR